MHRIKYPSLLSVKNIKKNVTSGTLDYCSNNDMLTALWKDNKVGDILSCDAGVEPKSSVQRYDKNTKAKKDVYPDAM